jgi:hypothetical protein
MLPASNAAWKSGPFLGQFMSKARDAPAMRRSFLRCDWVNRSIDSA